MITKIPITSVLNIVLLQNMKLAWEAPLNSIKHDPISNKTYLHLLDPDLFLVRIKLISLLDASHLNRSDFIKIHVLLPQKAMTLLKIVVKQ